VGGNHPGAFGAVRKHHKHEGIDIYGLPNDPVRSIKAGVVVDIYDFTGEHVGMPWWNDTKAIAIEDDDGIWVYGEVAPIKFLRVGQHIPEGMMIARLKPVLKQDKGRPMTMLHLERWTYGSSPKTILWGLNETRPDNLVDPTIELLRETTVLAS